MGGALEVGYLYLALTPPSIAWRAAAVSRILRKVQSSCMIFIFTVQNWYRSDLFFFSKVGSGLELHAPRLTCRSEHARRVHA